MTPLNIHDVPQIQACCKDSPLPGPGKPWAACDQLRARVSQYQML